MNTKILSDKALAVIDSYKNFTVANATCSIPYFNNARTGLRGALKAEIGKGTPKDIYDEVEQITVTSKIDTKDFTSETLKKFLVEKNLGIDCSAFVYYILNAESEERKTGGLDRHLVFPFAAGFLGGFKSKMRPVENTDVRTFAHEKNSQVVELKDVQIGDIITMIGSPNHILVIYRIEYQNFAPTTLHYVHAVAWPTDGLYGHGIHEGQIDIVNPHGGLLAQRWIELNRTDAQNHTFTRAQNSTTELRRLRFL
ncbi:MAG: hypothetical protein V4697_04290 [Patescibacteria group bacterium]